MSHTDRQTHRLYALIATLALLLLLIGVSEAHSQRSDSFSDIQFFQRTNPMHQQIISISDDQAKPDPFSSDNRFLVVFDEPSLLEKKQSLTQQKNVITQRLPAETRALVHQELVSYEAELNQLLSIRESELAHKGYEVLGTYKNIVHSVVFKGTYEQASLLLRRSYVREVHKLPPHAHILLAHSVPLIDGPLIRELTDNYGRELTGEGIKLAILDTGINYGLEDFGACPIIGSKCRVKGGYNFIHDTADPLDDHGHGTHVASIAAGAGASSGGLDGVAPRAELYVYKVLDENGQGGIQHILSALEASVDLNQNGVPFEEGNTSHIISMSLGFMGATSDNPLALFVDSLVQAGVVVVVAAGNAGPYDHTIGTPGTSREAITIGASYNDLYGISSLSASGESVESRAMYYSARGVLIADLVDAGYGINYNGIDAQGKIVLVERGEISFHEKALQAHAAGASGMIVYNDREGTFTGSLAGPLSSFIAVSISQEDGLALIDQLSQGSVSAHLEVVADILPTLQPAAFSSRGPVINNDLSVVIKPDILFPGVGICAASHTPILPEDQLCHPGGDYIAMSGTSMATPLAAGLAALMLQMHPDWSAQRVKSAMISSTMKGDYDVIEQGSGRIIGLSALNPNASHIDRALSFDFATGQEEVVVTRNITLFNPSINHRSYVISHNAPEVFDLSFDEQVIVPPMSNATLLFTKTVSGSIPRETYTYYVTITNEEDEEELHVPAIIETSSLITINLTLDREHFMYYVISFFDSHTSEQVTANIFVNPYQEQVRYLLPEDRLYDIVVWYYQLNSNTHFDDSHSMFFSESERKNYVSITTDVNLSLQSLINVDLTTLPYEIDLRPVLPGGETYDDLDAYDVRIVFDFNRVQWPLYWYWKTKSYYPHVDDQLMYPHVETVNSSVFYYDGIPERYRLELIGGGHKDSDVYLLQESLGSPNENLITNSTDEYALLFLNFSQLQPIAQQAVARIGTMYSGMHLFDILSYYESPLISVDSMNVFITSRPETFFGKGFWMNLYEDSLSVPRPLTPLTYDEFDDVRRAGWPDHKILLELSGLQEAGDKVMFTTIPIGLAPNTFTPFNRTSPVSANVNDAHLYPPLFARTRSQITPGDIYIDQTLLWQSGEPAWSFLTSFNLLAFGTVVITQDDQTREVVYVHHPALWLGPDSYQAEVFNLNTLNLEEPLLMEYSFGIPGAIPLINSYYPEYYNLSMTIYIQPSAPDPHPPTLLDVSIKYNNNPSPIVDRCFGVLRFTVADENLLDVQAWINNEEVVLYEHEQPYHVSVPDDQAIIEETDITSWFSVHNYQFSHDELFTFTIRAEDSSGNWFEQAIPIRAKGSCGIDEFAMLDNQYMMHSWVGDYNFDGFVGLNDLVRFGRLFS